jgi:hypothetical protein
MRIDYGIEGKAKKNSNSKKSIIAIFGIRRMMFPSSFHRMM